jgi:hypothetical protein
MNDHKGRTASGFTSVLVGSALCLGLVTQAAWAQDAAEAAAAPADTAEPALIAADATDETSLATSRQYSIRGGDLASAVDQLAEQSKLQIIYDSHLVEGKTAAPLSGSYSIRDALNLLLIGTDLEWEFVNGKTFVLRRPSP